MHKKSFLLSMALLFTFNNSINSSEYADSLAKLSLLYAGAGWGLQVIGDKLHKLSGAPEHEVVGKLNKRKIYFQKYNTDSIVKKNLSRIADSFSVAGETLIMPFSSAIWATFLLSGSILTLVDSGFHDLKTLLFEKGENRDWKTPSEVEFLTKKLGIPGSIVASAIPAIVGFGGPLLLQQLYKAMKK